MRIGMTLPIMEPGLDRRQLRQWIETIDRGPWASLAFGERVIFSNPDTMALLGACAAWTERVRLVTTIFIATLHAPVLLAKHIATADMLSAGRVTIGLGVGGREEDYQAAGAPLATRRWRELSARVAIMKKVWSGAPVVDGIARAVGPAPVQAGGPPLLAGAMGPKAVAEAARWADGVCGMSFGPDLDEIARSFAAVRAAWAAARRPAPHLGTAFWYAIAADAATARAQLRVHLKRYFTWLPEKEVAEIAETAGFAGTAHDLKAFLDKVAALGADEAMLISTSSDLAQVTEIAALLG